MILVEGTVFTTVLLASLVVIVTSLLIVFIQGRTKAVLVEFSTLTGKRGTDVVAVDCTHPFLPNLTHHKVSIPSLECLACVSDVIHRLRWTSPLTHITTFEPQGSKTPLHLKADTSGGIVLNAVLQGYKLPPKVSCNHFDADGSSHRLQQRGWVVEGRIRLRDSATLSHSTISFMHGERHDERHGTEEA